MEALYKTATTVDWVTILIFSSLLFVAIAKRLFYARFLNFIILPFNNKYIFMYNKKDRLLNWFHVCFTVFQVINFALFLYLGKNILENERHSTYPTLFLMILGTVLLFLVLKVGLQLSNATIFGSKKVISEIIFKKLSYLNYSGFILCAANIMLCFVVHDSLFVLYLAGFFVLLVNAIGWVNTLRNHQKFIAANFFYFILYLCALEIAPLIILGSYLNR